MRESQTGSAATFKTVPLAEPLTTNRILLDGVVIFTPVPVPLELTFKTVAALAAFEFVNDPAGPLPLVVLDNVAALLAAFALTKEPELLEELCPKTATPEV